MNTQDIVARPGRNSFFINLKLKEGISPAEANTGFSTFCSYYPPILNSIRIRYPNNEIKCSFGISRHFWDFVFPQTAPPKELVTFQSISGLKYTAPSTEGDLFLHIRADDAGICYEILKMLMDFLPAFTQPIYEVHGFRYLDGRAIIGFVDGTENPTGQDAIDDTIIGDEDPQYAGGSYIFTQKYLHDLSSWEKLTVEEQEKTIGRKKFDDVELFPEQKYPNAHSVMAKANDAEGNELKILRENVVFSNPSQNEYGTFFISYSNTFSTVETMLKHMFQGKGDITHDKLLEFSTPITGTLFFAPSMDLIDKFADGDIH